MVKGSTKQSAGADAGTRAPATKVGPPLLILALGFASVLVSLPLILLDGIATHLVGYVTGALVPIIVIGLVRRIDLDRRRSPYYLPKPVFGAGLAVLAVLAIVAAGLHVWPIATELAS